MKKVILFANRHFTRKSKISFKRKENGHYCASGSYILKTNYGRISLNFNNEIVLIQAFAYDFNSPPIKYHDGEDACSIKPLKNNHYSYLRTYEHLPRGEADKNGYYFRSTEDEVIEYITILLEELKSLEE